MDCSYHCSWQKQCVMLVSVIDPEQFRQSTKTYIKHKMITKLLCPCQKAFFRLWCCLGVLKTDDYRARKTKQEASFLGGFVLCSLFEANLDHFLHDVQWRWLATLYRYFKNITIIIIIICCYYYYNYYYYKWYR